MVKRKDVLTPEEKEYELLLGNVREVLKSRAGKAVIWHILSLGNIYSDSFTGNSTTFYNEGRRAIGLQVLQLLEDADPTLYPRLLLDNMNVKTEE